MKPVVLVTVSLILACAAAPVWRESNAPREERRADDNARERARQAAREREVASWPADWPTAVGDTTEYGLIMGRTVLRSTPCAKETATPFELRLHLRRGRAKNHFVLRLTAKNCSNQKIAFFHSGKTSPSEIVLDTPKRAWIPRYVCDKGADRTIRAAAFFHFKPGEERVLTEDGTSLGSFAPKSFLYWEDWTHELPPGTWRAYATFRSIHDRGSSSGAAVKIPNVWLGTLKSNVVELEIR